MMNRLQSHENGSNFPKFYVNSPAINRKFGGIGSHFHKISLRFPNYQTGSKDVVKLLKKKFYHKWGCHLPPVRAWGLHVCGLFGHGVGVQGNGRTTFFCFVFRENTGRGHHLYGDKGIARQELKQRLGLSETPGITDMRNNF